MNQQLNKIVLIVFVVTLSVIGCKPSNLLTLVLREYKAKSIRSTNDRTGDGATYSYFDGKFLGIITNDTVRSKRVIFGRLLGDIYGHRFEFDKQNVLSRYIFDVDGGTHYSYGIELLKDGQYSEMGSPYVTHWTDKSYASEDSTRYVFFFSKFPRKNVQAFYSYDSTNYLSLELEISKVMPYLVEGKIIIPNSIKAVNFKIEAESLLYSFKGLQEKRVFFETESLQLITHRSWRKLKAAQYAAEIKIQFLPGR